MPPTSSQQCWTSATSTRPPALRSTAATPNCCSGVRVGYVSRGPCVADRRKVYILINQGRLDEQNAPQAQRVADILNRYDDGQLDVITDFLARLTEAEIDAAAAAPAAPPDSVGQLPSPVVSRPGGPRARSWPDRC
jgi:hypothetical protein